jgi:hypothetical protein
LIKTAKKRKILTRWNFWQLIIFHLDDIVFVEPRLLSEIEDLVRHYDPQSAENADAIESADDAGDGSILREQPAPILGQRKCHEGFADGTCKSSIQNNTPCKILRNPNNGQDK